MAERTSPVFLVISSQVGWIVWVDLHSAAAAVVPFLTSHNGYYVNLLAGAKKRARSPLNQDRAQGKKLTLSQTETLTGGCLPCCCLRHRTSGWRHLRPRAGSHCHHRNSRAARCSCRRSTAAAPPEAQSAKTAARSHRRCHGTPTEAGSTVAWERRWMNPDCRIPSSPDCSASPVGCAALAGCRPVRRIAAIRRPLGPARYPPLPRPGAAANARRSAQAPPGAWLVPQPSNDSARQHRTWHAAARQTGRAPRGSAADARRNACWHWSAEHSSPRGSKTAGWRSSARSASPLEPCRPARSGCPRSDLYY